MSIKESSDELNPTMATAAAVPVRPIRSGKDYLALAIATCGVGYLPLAPGTWGSIVGIAVYLVVRAAAMKLFFDRAVISGSNLLQVYYGVLVVELLFAVALSLVGTWAASQTEKLSGTKDPSKVVIDEVAGQFIALLPVPYLFEFAWWSVILAFVLFRFFDIVKPYPARRLENISGGLGVMADDLIAGVYAAIGLMIVICVSWFV